MANQWEATLGAALKNLADAVVKATQLEITTHFVVPVDGQVMIKPKEGSKEMATVGKAVVSAYTRINLVDGDYLDVVPVVQKGDTYEVASEIHEIHKANVADARDYVADLVNSVMEVVQTI